MVNKIDCPRTCGTALIKTVTLTLLIQWSVLILFDLSTFGTVHWPLLSPGNNFFTRLQDTHSPVFLLPDGFPLIRFFLLPFLLPNFLILEYLREQSFVLFASCPALIPSGISPSLVTETWYYAPKFISPASTSLPKPRRMDLTAYWPFTSVPGNHLKLSMLTT